MDAHGEYRSATSQLRETLDTISNIAEELKKTGSGYTVRFTDARLRKAAETIIPLLEQIDRDHDYHKIVDRREADLNEREDALLKKRKKGKGVGESRERDVNNL